jgi:hypothetical protein
MDLILQIWDGSFYLANKVLFSFAEGRKGSSKRSLKIAGGMIYVLGVPAWVIVLIGKHNWIAASIEAGGFPAMLFGLFNAFKDTESINRKFDYGDLSRPVLRSLFGKAICLWPGSEDPVFQV